MPEVPLWKLKIDGDEFPPPEEEDVPLACVLTPEESERIEFSRQAEDSASWYDLKRKEYAEFEKSPEASVIRVATQTFLSEPHDLRAFLKPAKRMSGMPCWLILRIFFDQCKDSTTIDEVVAALWKPATDWVLHEKHREITLLEMNDLWKNVEAFEARPSEDKKPDVKPGEPEYDNNFRYLIPGEDE